MKKKKLDLSELEVESFAPRGGTDRCGTVNAHDWPDTWGEHCWDTEYECPSELRTDCWNCETAGATCTCRPGGDCSGRPDCQWA